MASPTYFNVKRGNAQYYMKSTVYIDKLTIYFISHETNKEYYFFLNLNINITYK